MYKVVYQVSNVYFENCNKVLMFTCVRVSLCVFVAGISITTTTDILYVTTGFFLLILSTKIYMSRLNVNIRLIH